MLTAARFVITEQLCEGNIERCCVIARFRTIHCTPAEKCKLTGLFDKLKAPLLKCFHLYKGSNTVENIKKKLLVY